MIARTTPARAKPARAKPARTKPARRLALLAGAALLPLLALPVGAQTLRIGLNEDGDGLDPHRARTFVGRIVFAALCDKLVDTAPDLKFVPRLALSWETAADGKALTFKLRPGVTFHDGEAFDAAAVKYNIERAKSLPDSLRKSELASVEAVEVVDPLTVALKLSRPDAALLAQLSDRAGMMVSPKAAEAAGAAFPQRPVCSGPFRFVERVAQDRIVLERYEGFWNRAQVNLERVVFRPIPDRSVRFANLRSGDLELVERLSPTDVKAVKADKALTLTSVVGLGFQGMYVNIGNGERAKTPVGLDKRVRQALSLGLDREAINQAVFDGAYAPAAQFFPPESPWFDKDVPVPKRDVAKARALLKAAGAPTPLKVEVGVPTSPLEQQVAQVMQAMWSEIGVETSIRATEFATLLKGTAAGDFQLSQYGWSGRTDPDGNVHQFTTCKGSLNEAKYCNPAVDALLDEARAVAEPAARKALYDKAAVILAEDLPYIHTYHEAWLWAATARLKGFAAHPDGMIRLEGVSLGAK